MESIAHTIFGIGLITFSVSSIFVIICVFLSWLGLDFIDNEKIIVDIFVSGISLTMVIFLIAFAMFGIEIIVGSR